ncbi:MAG: malate dehydrogenase [Acidobacteria bacterium]|nr:malate dehydrogenase [Acidobacteriota bacterium]NIM63559.1 malate dehydrogenase [Acidobacteriota bacterium]NIO59175.1 malate dehydrogenase [Acidobacteriota bacterium]NIQ30206.1 malate dehydrogenase [Acidobacteriota bacterium]NIQ85122.1 malate dehydrogenase [Acidobacteriota bacterium]
MSYLTEDKLVIFGSAGAIGSNMVQAALTMGLTPNIAMVDPYDKGNEGAAEEIYHCAFPGANVTWTANAGEGLRGARYLISSGGAPRKEGMTREDLLKGNAEIAAQLGRDIKEHAPELKFGVIIFNPADITGLVTLVHSGLAPSKISTLAALDSTRLQTALAQHFNVRQDEVTGCRTYGGHGEMMAVFASTAKVSGRPLTELIGTDELPDETWESIKQHVRQGGKRIIQLRGRSSFQSPSHQSLVMVKSVIEGGGYPWPAGAYVDDADAGFTKLMMAMETTLDRDGVTWAMPAGTESEIAELRASAEHLSKLRDEVVEMGVLPPLDAWTDVNPNF